MSKAKLIVSVSVSASILIVLSFFLLHQLAICVLSESGLGGSGDWFFDGLPGYYEIWKINGADISLIKKTSEFGGKKIVEPFVISFCWDNRYIGIQRGSYQKGCQPDATDVEYYIVDSSTEKVFGPFDLEEYKEQSAIFDFYPNGWVQTVPDPKGVKR